VAVTPSTSGDPPVGGGGRVVRLVDHDRLEPARQPPEAGLVCQRLHRGHHYRRFDLVGLGLDQPEPGVRVDLTDLVLCLAE